MRRWTLRNDRPDPRELDDMAGLLIEDEVLILPTDTIYGLHGRATSETATDAIRSAKRRRDDQPFVVLCSNIEQIRQLGARPASGTLESLDRIWPAPLTAILPIAQPIPASSGQRSLAVRIPDLDWLRDLIEGTGPLASTSTNLSGEPPATNVSDIPDSVLKRVTGLVDSGTLDRQPSTLVQFTDRSPKVLREGAFSFTQKLWKTVWKSL